MRNPQSAAVVKEAVLPCRLSSTCLGFACLILTALVPQGAVAQTYLDVTLRGTQSSVTAQAPGAASFTVRYRYDDVGHTHAWFCNWPTPDDIVARYQALETAGQLPQHLALMDQHLNVAFSVSNVRNAIPTFFPGLYTGTLFSGADREFTRQQFAAGAIPSVGETAGSRGGGQPQSAAAQQLATMLQSPPGPLTVEMATRCLDENEAKTALYAIRNAVRSYLAPTPAN